MPHDNASEPKPPAQPDTAGSDVEAEMRLQTELDLLRAMYPDQIAYDAGVRELQYASHLAAPTDAPPQHKTDKTNPTPTLTLTLRIPPTYPVAGRPRLARVATTTNANVDVAALQASLQRALDDPAAPDLPPEGDEALDAILASFDAHVAAAATSGAADTEPATTAMQHDVAAAAAAAEPHRTVVIWLHHLLAAGKRKAALAAPSALVRGVVKPGYPGVLVFSGPGGAVGAHVAALKALRWQAFQVRLEVAGGWEVQGESEGGGVREVESMAEVVGAFGDEGQRRALMEALRIK